MIAYRAESALAGEARETLARSDAARVSWRRLFVTAANLRPDHAAGTLSVTLHRCGSALQDATIADFCATPHRDGNLFLDHLPPPLLPPSGITLIPVGVRGAGATGCSTRCPGSSIRGLVPRF